MAAGQDFVTYYDHLMEILNTNEELKKTGKGMIKQMGWAAGGVGVGGMFGGLVGGVIGGLIGLTLGVLKAADNYSSMLTVLRELTDEEKQNLVDKVQRLVGNAAIDALATFITFKVKRKLLFNCIRQVLNNRQGGR